MPLSRFDVVARVDPQTLIRLLNPFAQLGLLPSRVDAIEAEGLVTVCIEQPDLAEQQARIIAEKMRSYVLVEAVSLRCGTDTLSSIHEAVHELSA